MLPWISWRKGRRGNELMIEFLLINELCTQGPLNTVLATSVAASLYSILESLNLSTNNSSSCYYPHVLESQQRVPWEGTPGSPTPYHNSSETWKPNRRRAARLTSLFSFDFVRSSSPSLILIRCPVISTILRWSGKKHEATQFKEGKSDVWVPQCKGIESPASTIHSWGKTKQKKLGL